MNNYYYPNYLNPYKIVESKDMVKATEVPIGGFGVFPKANLEEVYIKTWNPNGTTNIVTYKPDTESAKTQEAIILDRLDELEKKLAALGSGQHSPQRKESKANEY